MTMKKRITSFALVLLMVLSSLAVLLPVTGVKAAAAGETKTYTKVTTAPTDWSGEYLIVYEKSKTEGYIFNGALETLDAAGNNISVAITDGSITIIDGVDYSFTIAKSGSDYSIQSASGYYIGGKSGKNQLLTSKNAYVNTIRMEGNAIDIISFTSHLRFNADSNNLWFRYFKSSSYTNQKAIQLYKLDTSSTPTEPDVPVHEGDHTYGDWTCVDNTTHSHQCTIEGCKATETAKHEITWTYLDENKHTGKCKYCGYTADAIAHTWVSDETATPSIGMVAEKCEICGQTREVKLDYNAEIVFKNQGWSNQQVIDTIKLSNGVVITFNKGTNSNTPKYFTKGTEIRVYGGGYITIKAPAGRVISSITLTDGAGNSISANTGSLNSGVWSGAAETLTFTVDGTSGNYNFTGLNVKCADAPRIDSATLNIGTNIDVNYYVVLPEGISYEKYVMRFTFNGKTIDVESTTGDKFTFKNVGPHQMGLNISAVLYGVNGETETKLSEKATYSVKENLESLLTNENETVKTLAKNMLIYGAAAQKYTGAADADLVTSETHTATPNLTTSGLKVKNDATESAVIKFVGMKLIFDNEPILAIRYVIVWDDPDLTITANDITFKDGNDNVLAHDGEYVYLNSVTANKFGTNVTVKNDLDTSEVLLNVNTYIYYILNSTTASDNMKALATALYYYGVAAEAYVNAQTTQQ